MKTLCVRERKLCGRCSPVRPPAADVPIIRPVFSNGRIKIVLVQGTRITYFLNPTLTMFWSARKSDGAILFADTVQYATGFTYSTEL